MATTSKKASSVNHPSKVILKILFKEILQQITPEDAESLTESYRQGGVIGFHIKENSRRSMTSRRYAASAVVS